ncbi:MAG: hypothetical protein R3E42_09635 [Burkholderiaceae bacterium]
MTASVPSRASARCLCRRLITPPSANKARFWNRIARQQPPTHRRIKRATNTLRRVQALLSPSDDVIELGCGYRSTALGAWRQACGQAAGPPMCRAK